MLPRRPPFAAMLERYILVRVGALIMRYYKQITVTLHE